MIVAHMSSKQNLNRYTWQWLTIYIVMNIFEALIIKRIKNYKKEYPSYDNINID